MDVARITDKISTISDTVLYYRDMLVKTYNNAAIKINRIIDKIENAINHALATLSQGVEWLEMKLKGFMHEIEEILATLKKKINEIIAGIDAWYQKVTTHIKVAGIRSGFALIGQDINAETAETLAASLLGSIPPPISTMISADSFEVPIKMPDVSNLVNIGPITMDRIKLLEL